MNIERSRCASEGKSETSKTTNELTLSSATSLQLFSLLLYLTRYGIGTILTHDILSTLGNAKQKEHYGLNHSKNVKEKINFTSMKEILHEYNCSLRDGMLSCSVHPPYRAAFLQHLPQSWHSDTWDAQVPPAWLHTSSRVGWAGSIRRKWLAGKTKEYQ